MSYQSQWKLQNDDAFVSRTRAAISNQSMIFKDDARPDMAAMAEALLRGDVPGQTLAFVAMVAAAPGFADTADNGEGGVDSSLIPDADILAAVQADYPTVAALYYDAEGNPLP
jgi:hypothetical protein